MKTRLMATVILFIIFAALYSFQVAVPQESPKAKCAKEATLPKDALNVMQEFQDALKQAAWEKALSYCSERVVAAAKQYDSAADFFRNVVPITKIIQLKRFPIWQVKWHGDKEIHGFGCFVRIKESDIEPTISWEWSLNKTSTGWLIDFQSVPFEQWIQQETLRKKRKAEEYAEKRKALEQKLKDVEIRLTPVSDTFILGQPMLFRLELINNADVELSYADQQVDVNDSMIITDENGDRVPFIEEMCQTAVSFNPIKPGERAVLFDNFDISSQYAVLTPGTYKVQFSGKGLLQAEAIEEHHDEQLQEVIMTDTRIPSNVVEIQVTPSALE